MCSAENVANIKDSPKNGSGTGGAVSKSRIERAVIKELKTIDQ